MTATPQFVQLVPKGSFPSIPQSRGRVRWFKYPAYEGTFTIMPTVVPWPYVNDANGQPYPAGLVGVRQSYTPQYADVYTGSHFDIIPVPSILPAGYTHRWDRAHALNPGSQDPSRGQAWFAAGFGPLPPTHAGNAAHLLRFPNGGGNHAYYYMPEARGDDAYNSTIVTSGWGFSAPTAGLRYIQWKGVQPGITVQLRCNADGSRGTGLSIGDTVLATYTNGGGSNADSPLFTAGLQFPLGEKRWLYFRVTPVPPDVINLIAGPRVDIPLPWTCTGVGLIAPGGYVAAMLDVRLPT